MVADDLLAEIEGARGEVAVILREMLAKGDAKAGWSRAVVICAVFGKPLALR